METIEEYYDNCLALISEKCPDKYAQAKKLLNETPILSYLARTAGIHDLYDLAIQFEFDDQEAMCSYLSGLCDEELGTIEWVLLKGTELKNGSK